MNPRFRIGQPVLLDGQVRRVEVIDLLIYEDRVVETYFLEGDWEADVGHLSPVETNEPEVGDCVTFTDEYGHGRACHKYATNGLSCIEVWEDRT